LSTAPGGATVPGMGDWAGWVVLGGGLAFLLVRPALGGVAFAVPLLAAGYLILGAGALVTGVSRGSRGVPRGGGALLGGAARRGRGALRGDRAPLGWVPVLAIGLLAVVVAGMVGGPVAERPVGMAAVLLAVVAAVSEEALFRGLLYGRLERFGPLVAVLGSAGVFALVHLPGYGVAAMPVDLGAALLLSWQRYACGRWTVPAVTHVVANLLAVT
jgi:membrane protease YdiL (CAAX protease family)